ncbi:MAG: hypothetical protein MO846_10250 [Candidatus Devosia symbiotica]|nr:hypothetical protein [Candidatus Devosia symbiotica]
MSLPALGLSLLIGLKSDPGERCFFAFILSRFVPIPNNSAARHQFSED